MTVMHDPGPAGGSPKLFRALQYPDRKHGTKGSNRRMNSDDLPIYPTPQQATYTMPPLGPPASRRNPQPLHYQPGHLGAPVSNNHPHQGSSGGYGARNPSKNSTVPPPVQDYGHQIHGRPYQPQYYQQPPPPPPPPQQQQPQQPQHAPASVASLQYLNQTAYLKNSYQAPAQSPQFHQNVPPPPIQNSPAPRVSSATSSHYSSASQPIPYHLGGQYQSAPTLSLPGTRNGSYTGHQYAHTPAQVQPLSPPGRSHGPSKKPPLSSRSRENVDEVPKPSSKQRLEAELRATFDRVDTNRSGKISARELSLALINFDNTGFQHSTVRLMIKLFSSPSSGSSSGLNFEQFVSLWKYLTAYKKLFVAADVNKSGDISFGEFQRIIEQIGYKLNVDLVLHLFQKFANKEAHDDGSVAVGKLKFDAFIELLVYLRKLTDIFKQYDKQLTGVATIDYLDFLLEISNLT